MPFTNILLDGHWTIVKQTNVPEMSNVMAVAGDVGLAWLVMAIGLADCAEG